MCVGGKREPSTHWFVCGRELLRIFIDDFSGNVGNVYLHKHQQWSSTWKRVLCRLCLEHSTTNNCILLLSKRCERENWISRFQGHRKEIQTYTAASASGKIFLLINIHEWHHFCSVQSAIELVGLFTDIRLVGLFTNIRQLEGLICSSHNACNNACRCMQRSRWCNLKPFEYVRAQSAAIIKWVC